MSERDDETIEIRDSRRRHRRGPGLAIDAQPDSPRHSIREGEVIRDRLAGLDPDTERLFRINSGVGWVGRVVQRREDLLVLADPRPLRAAPEGWPDMFGWKTIEITPDMVGLRVAVATGEEVKCSGDLRPEQRKFRACLERMGGVYRVLRP